MRSLSLPSSVVSTSYEIGLLTELPAEGEKPLEQQFLAALLHLAAMKVDEESVE